MGARPTVGDLPAQEKEDGDGIEGLPPLSGGPAQQLSQDGPQGAEVDQTEDDLEVGEIFASLGVVQRMLFIPVGPASVGVVRAVSVLG